MYKTITRIVIVCLKLNSVEKCPFIDIDQIFNRIIENVLFPDE